MWAFYNLTYHQLLTVVTYQANLPNEVSCLAAMAFKSTHIGTQHFGDHDTAIRLLVIFKNGNDGARQRQPGTVEGMHKFWFCSRRWTVSNLCPPGLKALAIAARTNLTPFLAAIARAFRPGGHR